MYLFVLLIWRRARLSGRGRNATRSASFLCQGVGGAGRQILSHRTFLCAVRSSVHLSLTPFYILLSAIYMQCTHRRSEIVSARSPTIIRVCICIFLVTILRLINYTLINFVIFLSLSLYIKKFSLRL